MPRRQSNSKRGLNQSPYFKYRALGLKKCSNRGLNLTKNVKQDRAPSPPVPNIGPEESGPIHVPTFFSNARTFLFLPRRRRFLRLFPRSFPSSLDRPHPRRHGWKATVSSSFTPDVQGSTNFHGDGPRCDREIASCLSPGSAKVCNATRCCGSSVDPSTGTSSTNDGN
jgi:hypothetical protein